jgi:hypothetical protein
VIVKWAVRIEWPSNQSCIAVRFSPDAAPCLARARPSCICTIYSRTLMQAISEEVFEHLFQFVLSLSGVEESIPPILRPFKKWRLLFWTCCIILMNEPLRDGWNMNLWLGGKASDRFPLGKCSIKFSNTQKVTTAGKWGFSILTESTIEFSSIMS